MKSTATAKKWPASSYRVTKLLLTIYVHLISKKYGDYFMLSMCPGWCRTDMGGTHAKKSAEQGASDLMVSFRQFEQIEGSSGEMVYDFEIQEI